MPLNDGHVLLRGSCARNPSNKWGKMGYKDPSNLAIILLLDKFLY